LPASAVGWETTVPFENLEMFEWMAVILSIQFSCDAHFS
jgi:hypothetical protein